MRQKKNAFGMDLIRAAGFPLQAAEAVCARKTDPAGLYRQSALYYASFCEKVDRAFVTPLDRRDLLEMASGFHRLTGRISRLPASVFPEAGSYLLGMCRALREALVHWRPFGCKTNAMGLYLQKAWDCAAKGIETADWKAVRWSIPAVWIKAADGLIHLEACFQCGSELADLIRRIQIQNG